MAKSQPPVAAHVIAFSAYQDKRVQNVVSCLTTRDRLDISSWREAASLAGFDRLVIHEREEDDASEVGNFLGVYRRGEAWSRWSFARRNGSIRVWCSLSWADKGEYETMAQAFEAVLGVVGPVNAVGGVTGFARAGHNGALITDLVPRLRDCQFEPLRQRRVIQLSIRYRDRRWERARRSS